ncbi:hypothetical protein [Oceanicella actignis]|uniref:hypothetical protein n=1 Tax=Oceanicella actignis TaxID=1189325 RepID=UPI0011E7BF79|nr:hypothetical protein [Oceanicella actignis]
MTRGVPYETISAFFNVQVTFLSITGGILLAVLAVSGDFVAIGHFTQNQLRLEELHVDHNLMWFVWLIFLFLLTAFGLSLFVLVQDVLSDSLIEYARPILVAMSIWAGLLSLALPWVLQRVYRTKFRRMQDARKKEDARRVDSNPTPRPDA